MRPEINGDHSPVAIFDGGDLTTVVGMGELGRLEICHTNLENETSLAFRLGNHDYAYDTNQNVLYTNDNVLRMLDYFVRKIPSVPNVLAVDFSNAENIVDDSRTPSTATRYKGSMAYTMEINGYVFFMLHWSAAIGDDSFSRKVEEYNPGTSDYVYYDITAVSEWLEEHTLLAASRQKKIVLIPHSRKALTPLLGKAAVKYPTFGTIRSLIASTPIVAILSGHDHDDWGEQTDTVRFKSKNLPVIYAGSLSYQTLVLLEFAASGGGVQATPYDSRDGDTCGITPMSDTNGVGFVLATERPSFMQVTCKRSSCLYDSL